MFRPPQSIHSDNAKYFSCPELQELSSIWYPTFIFDTVFPIGKWESRKNYLYDEEYDKLCCKRKGPGVKYYGK